MQQEKTLKVSVCVITYNQDKYIRQCLQSIVDQKTNFSFEVIVGDDCSLDGTRAVVREFVDKYPNIVNPIFRDKNIGPINNSSDVLTVANGKYIAALEGDDYWIDPLKLQKQVDFLETHSDYGMVCTDFNIFHQSRHKMEVSLFKNQPKRFPIYNNIEDFLLAKGYMAPCTWLLRKEYIPTYPKKYLDGSFAWLLDVFATTKIYCLPDTTAVYRILRESASHTMSIEKRYARVCSIFENQLDYIHKYNLADSLKLKVIKEHYRSSLRILVALGKTDEIKKAEEYLPKNERRLLDKFILLCSKFRGGDKIIRFLIHFKERINNRRI